MRQDFLAGKPLLVFVAEGEHGAFHAQLTLLQRNSVEKVQDWQIRLQPRDGVPFPAALTIGSVRGADGRLTGLRWSLRDITDRKQLEEERERLIVELQGALAKIKRLSGLLPICSSCKKIRDDQGYWQQVEVYLWDHSEAEFTHGLCPDCVKRLYPDYCD